MVETADPAQRRHGLSLAMAARCRVALEAAGLGPVEIRRAAEGADMDSLLDVRVGPFHRVVTTEDEVQTLLEERQTCYF